MNTDYLAPWHRESYDRFLSDSLPRLLAERLPLSGYHFEITGPHQCSVTVNLASRTDQLTLSYEAMPYPDDEGLFEIDDSQRVVVPVAEHSDLDRAEIKCVGELLLDFVAERLGTAPKDVRWDESVARAMLPLTVWVNEFLITEGEWLDQSRLGQYTHLRRIKVANPVQVADRSHFGRVCMFEVPEGPNIGRIYTVAIGAEIRDGRIARVDESPAGSLGLSASCIPFLEHSDPNRLTFGANMMRQWITPPDPEAALVQTGLEPDSPGFWCGRNLLTAFVSLGQETFEDGIVISESCAKRLDYPVPAEPGDKLSNRHGTRGVISRILPDDEMPHLEDGTPVELAYSFVGLHARLNYGQIREAVLSRIARVEGEPALAPPFASPGEQELRERLAAAGLSPDGQEQLTLGRDGHRLEMQSTVGWVYWGKTNHLAVYKLRGSRATGRCMRQSERDYYAMKELGAFENIADLFNTRSLDRPDSGTLYERAAAGPVTRAGAPGPLFLQLQRRLGAAGIRAELDDGRLTFVLREPVGEVVELPVSVTHPWLRNERIRQVGVVEDSPSLDPLRRATAGLNSIVGGDAPEALRQKATADVEARLTAYLDDLVTPDAVRFWSRSLFSGRGVLAPGIGLHAFELGVPDELARDLFGDVEDLDEVMSRSWVTLNRAPTIIPVGAMAFRPVRLPGRVLRLHPSVCRLMNADFDGDQAAVFRPVSEAAQREAGEKLSLFGHLRHNPELIRDLLPSHDPMWGLAWLSLKPGGRERIEEALGARLEPVEDYVTRAQLADALRELLDEVGVEAAVERLEAVVRLGFEAASKSGASLSPFPCDGLAAMPKPTDEAPEVRQALVEQVNETILAQRDYASPALGPQVLAVKSGTRGHIGHLATLCGFDTVLVDGYAPGNRSLVDGLTHEGMMGRVARARQSLADVTAQVEQGNVPGYGDQSVRPSQGFNVLARAMRSKHPGIVFARAAAAGEVDPLTDIDSRMFVGLMP